MVPARTMPGLGLGTYRVTDYDECVDAVTTALDVGYRYIDTAEAYQNENAVGDAIANSDSVSRDDVFLATKVLHPKFANGYTRDAVIDAAHGCLDRLGVDRVDLLYGVHWPGGDYDPEETFAACETLYEEGVMDSLGVCNLTPTLIDEARSASNVPISVLQIELHPLLQQEAIREYCDRHDMDLVGYAPFGNGRIFDVPELQEIASKHDISVAEVTLAWFREKGIATIPKSTNSDHIRENWESQQIRLDSDDIQSIDTIPRQERQYDPDYAPDW